ncbi:hypothetical protein ACHAWF_008917 [Thalassiosira exigua]
MEGTYRSFMTPGALARSMNRQPSEQSLPVEGRFWESNNASSGSGGTFFAIRASLMGELSQSRGVDPGAGRGVRKCEGRHPQGRTNKCPSREDREEEPPKPKPKQEWTASERANRVAQTKMLRRSLAAEVEKAGVVTAAGYRAVHDKFLYSDAVEEEMSRFAALEKRKPGRLRGSRIGGLMSSLGNAAAQNLYQSQTQYSNGQAPVTKKLSSGSGASEGAANAAAESKDESNLAPRRKSSQVVVLTQSQQEELLKEDQEHQNAEREKLMMNSFLDRLDQSENNVCGRTENRERRNDHGSSSASVSSQEPRPCLHRRDSCESLDLQDIFNGKEGATLLSSALFQDTAPEKPQEQTSSTCCTTFSRLDTLSSKFNEVNFDPDETNVAAKGGEEGRDKFGSSTKSIERSYTDKCGWLPWPEEDGDSNEDELLDEDGVFWPSQPRNHRARAA